MAYEHPPGKGSLKGVGVKTNERGPDFKGVLVLDRDYKAGETIKLGAWEKVFDWGKVFNLAINTYTPPPKDADKFPKEIKRDGGDVPF